MNVRDDVDDADGDDEQVIVSTLLRHCQVWRKNKHILSQLINYKFIKLQPFIRFVDVSATTAAFIRMTVHHHY